MDGGMELEVDVLCEEGERRPALLVKPSRP